MSCHNCYHGCNCRNRRSLTDGCIAVFFIWPFLIGISSIIIFNVFEGFISNQSVLGLLTMFGSLIAGSVATIAIYRS
jgi:hypothetical protein